MLNNDTYPFTDLPCNFYQPEAGKMEFAYETVYFEGKLPMWIDEIIEKITKHRQNNETISSRLVTPSQNQSYFLPPYWI